MSARDGKYNSRQGANVIIFSNTGGEQSSEYERL
jgi:hypothetical protein